MNLDYITGSRYPLLKLKVKVNVGIFKIVGVQEEKCGGAGRRSLCKKLGPIRLN